MSRRQSKTSKPPVKELDLTRLKCGICKCEANGLDAIYSHLLTHNKGSDFTFNKETKTVYPKHAFVTNETQTGMELLADIVKIASARTENQSEDVKGIANTLAEADESPYVVVEVEHGQNYVDIVKNIQQFVVGKTQVVKKGLKKSVEDENDTVYTEIGQGPDYQIQMNSEPDPKNKKSVKSENVKNESDPEEEMQVLVEVNAETDYEDEEVYDEPLSDMENIEYALDGTETKKTAKKRKATSNGKEKEIKKIKEEGVQADLDFDEYYDVSPSRGKANTPKVPVGKKRKSKGKGSFNITIDFAKGEVSAEQSQYSKKKKTPKEKKPKDPNAETVIKNPLDYHIDVIDCPYCPNRYSSKNNFYEHMETKHGGQYTMICKGCCIPFFTEEHLMYHAAECKSSRPKIHTCHYCNEESLFVVKARLEQHLKEAHNNSKPFKCTECQEELVSKYEQIEHSGKHDPQVMMCEHCPKPIKKVYKSLLHLDGHFASAHCVPPNICYICQINLKSFSLVEHLKTHFQFNAAACQYCGNVYSGKYAIRSHNLICRSRPDGGGKKRPEASTLYICDQCSTSFLGGRKLREHMSRVHGVGQTHPCRVCSKVFFRLDQLVRHERRHTNVKHHICTDCGKPFSSFESLEEHRLSHMVGGLRCGKCDALFPDKRRKEAHEAHCTVSSQDEDDVEEDEESFLTITPHPNTVSVSDIS
ncbi:zinc finger protein 189-like [Mya arenaria]|uniref:zinc finger protein 189-like n=1 Tax=Mya arenaria TaxID=6604 RepID=UPI0022E1D711|nr:zinc finger protein 189-like [Mya arenaria]